MRTMAELFGAAEKGSISLGEAALRWQMAESRQSEEAVKARMAQALAVMKESVQAGLDPNLRSVSGMVGGGAAKLAHPAQAGRFGLLGKAAAYALSVAESNACMGKIVAAPTAGSCGILPGALLAAQEEQGFEEDALVMALFAAAAVGRVIALSATISGAQGGCQAESGTAAAMTAAALVQLYGGSPRQALDAAGFAIMNMMGLVCDPVHGLVEVPCVYRNVGGVSQALAAAQMALGGLACPIEWDALIGAMKDVGESLPLSLRETGEGGCAACSFCAP
ncbi:MAG: L-serine ammonia-lyase, iron-sulfur-dependent, subunit alpha [Clostridiales bacterium]|nr:L-serine ammonia-lyase, iron-sulfur-dependent, subunit alpha [Clostridiales bacterium]